MITLFEGQCAADKRRFIEELIDFCADKLMKRHQNVTVTVQLIKGFEKNTGQQGATTVEGDAVRGKCADFLIELDTALPMSKILRLVAHEMVHVKQFATGELQDSKRGVRFHKWLGREIDIEKTNYWDYPWEIEAYGREAGLFVRWTEDTGYDLKYRWAGEE